MTDIVLGVSGIALDAGKVLLARRGRGPYRSHWSLPGGRVEPMERHREALVREFQEETGLEIAVGEPAGIAEIIDLERSRHYVILVYFVDITRGNPRPGDDAAALRWVGREELQALTLTPGLERYLEDFKAWKLIREDP